MSSSKNNDDGVVTSAPASSVGSLLTDLLSEAKKDVAAERQQLEQQLKSKEEEERERRAREEARKREQMQQRLIEETRRRNEALAGAKASGSPLSTARHTRPQMQAVKDAKAEPELKVTAPPAPAGFPKVLVAVAVVVGLVIGLGGAMALTPPAKLVLPDIDKAAQAVVAQTARAASAEGKVIRALTDANGRIDALEKKMSETLAAHQKLVGELKLTQGKLEATEKALAGLGKEKPKYKKPPVREAPIDIDLNAFKTDKDKK